MKQYISELIIEAVTVISPEESAQVLAVSKFDVTIPDLEFGDYATNVAMILFKQFKAPPASNPAELANLIAKKIIELDRSKTFSDVVSVGGFINFKLSFNVLQHNLQAILDQKSAYGSLDIGQNQKMLLEYFQPNMAKPLHLGHLRTAIIGDSLFRILKFSGFKVESDTHLGDWGTQFGLLLLAYKKWGDQKLVALNPILELNKLYVKINEELEGNDELREAGKQEFVKLEQGDAENLKLWNQFRDWSWQEYSVIYDDLGVRKSDHDWPESFFADKMPAVIEQLKTSGLLHQSQGAQIINLEEHNLGIAVIVKSDGGTTYLLRDLATYIYRQQQGFVQQIYVVDNRQSHTLNQTFKILELLGEIINSDQALHIAYGFLSLPDGAMSTRKGTIIGANELIKKAETKALEIIEQKNPNLQNKAKVAKQVMQAAIKYFDLSHNYKSDIVFDWDRALSFEGNTGPYLQYTHARIYGILRKAPEINNQSIAPSLNGLQDLLVEEIKLIKKLRQFPDSIESATLNSTPNLICNYLLELAQSFNQFYEAVAIIQEKNEAKKLYSLQVIKATAQVLSNGLNLLGIEAPEEM